MSSTPAQINPLLARYLASLATRPLYTKSVTAGVLLFLQDVVSNYLAKVPVVAPKNAPAPQKLLASVRINERALMMASFGFFIQAPLNHTLSTAVAKAVEGKTGPAARLGQLVGTMFVTAPITNFVYLASMAIISGARSQDAILNFVKASYWKFMQATWVIQPLSIVLAQKFVPPELWVVFFNFVGFSLGTLANVVAKKKQMRKLKEEAARREREKRA